MAATPAIDRNIGAAADAGRGTVVLGDGIEILQSERLRELDTATARAHAARSSAAGAAPLFALVPTAEPMPRWQVAQTLRGLNTPGLLPLVAYGAVPWSANGERRPAFVLHRPPGPSLAEAPPQAGGRDLVRRVVRPALTVLRRLRDLDVAHRGIRPDNVFWADDERSAVALGDCVTGPAGCSQPAMYEPLGRAQADPAARGGGGIADDLFALGVLIAELAVRHSPAHGLSEEELMLRRLDMGTAGFIQRACAVPPTFTDLVCGLTEDDAERRWTLDDVEAWIAGHETPKARPRTVKQADRPFLLQGAGHRTAPALAFGLARHWREAAAPIREGDVGTWARRNLNDEKIAEAVDRASGRGPRTARGGAIFRNDVLVAKTCIALDPGGPIRYRDLAFAPDGLAQVLVRATRDAKVREDTATLIGYLSSADLGAVSGHGIGSLLGRLGLLKRAVASCELGQGLERCLYELDGGMPCLSPLLPSFTVFSIRDLLSFVEKRALGGEPPRKFLDAHVAAFLAARGGRGVERLIGQAVGRSEAALLLRDLHVFARLQRGAGIGPLPGIAAQLVAEAAAVVSTFRHRGVREKVERALEQSSHGGDLEALVALLDDASIRRRDAAGFSAARREFARNLRVIATLSDPERSGAATAAARGRSLAATISMTLSAVGLGGAIVMFLG